jgi:hypothetical protein
VECVDALRIFHAKAQRKTQRRKEGIYLLAPYVLNFAPLRETGFA